MTLSKFRRFTYPLLLKQILAVLLGRFFDRFKDDLLARNCCLPSAPPGTEAYCNRRAHLREPEHCLIRCFSIGTDHKSNSARVAKAWERLGKAKIVFTDKPQLAWHSKTHRASPSPPSERGV